ncbi:hypothetical protein [Streptomyces sp. NPDC001657]|uniref:hypothetical protein n=1 Tax=unclassified Streptomyces TaxID=2593676 RepID=UPI00332E0499
MALLATGNASLVVRDEVIALPVRGISPSHLAIADRRDDEWPLVMAYLAAAAQLGAGTS